MIRIEDSYTGHGSMWYTVSELAKQLNLKDAKGRYIGRNKMYQFLRDEKIIMDNNYPYQYYITLDMVQMHKVVRGNYTLYLPIFSQRGVNFLNKKYGTDKENVREDATGNGAQDENK